MTALAIRHVDAIATALDIVNDPALYCNYPSVLPCAWETLMHARGNRVDMARIATPRHLIDRHGGASGTIHDLQSGMAARIKARIAARAAKIGHTGPAPLILK